MSDNKPKHLFKDYPYSITFGRGTFHQIEKKNGSVIYHNEKTMELIKLTITGKNLELTTK